MINTSFGAHLPNRRAQVYLLDVVAAIDWAELNLLDIVAGGFLLEFQLRLEAFDFCSAETIDLRAFLRLFFNDKELIVHFDWFELLLGPDSMHSKSRLFTSCRDALSLMHCVEHFEPRVFETRVDFGLVAESLFLCNVARTILRR